MPLPYSTEYSTDERQNGIPIVLTNTTVEQYASRINAAIFVETFEINCLQPRSKKKKEKEERLHSPNEKGTYSKLFQNCTFCNEFMYLYMYVLTAAY